MADKRFPGGAANYSVSDFAAAWLRGVGAPVTPQNIAAFNAWANAESSGYNPSASGGRGFATGRMFTAAGVHVASAAQEGLLRPVGR